MRLKLFVLSIILILMMTSCRESPKTIAKLSRFEVQKIGELPASDGMSKNPGLAGAFSGIVNSKLIVAGGNNFPDRKPWEGGTKIFYRTIYCFEIGEDTLQSIPVTASLPEPLAYGSSVTLPEGILCIGGNGPERCSSKVFLIKWDEVSKDLKIEDFPDLPVPVSFGTAASAGNKVYLMGGTSVPNGSDSVSHFFRLDLSAIDKPDFKWEKLPSFPGMSRILSVSAVQSNGTKECVYLFSGRNFCNPDKPVVFTDGMFYDPELRIWEAVQTSPQTKFQLMAGSAFRHGLNDIVFVGGAPDSTFLKEVGLKAQLSDALANANKIRSEQLKDELLTFYNTHKGFDRRLLQFNAIKGTISQVGEFSSFCPVTTNVIPYGDGALVVCGEIKPGIRTPDIYRIKVRTEK